VVGGWFDGKIGDHALVLELFSTPRKPRPGRHANEIAMPDLVHAAADQPSSRFGSDDGAELAFLDKGRDAFTGTRCFLVDQDDQPSMEGLRAKTFGEEAHRVVSDSRAEFTLREFDRFLAGYAAKQRQLRLDQAALEWLSRKPGRKPVSVSADAAVLRQLFAFLRRSPDRAIQEPVWPKLPTESVFVPHFLSEHDILKLLALCASLNRPRFRATLYRALLLVLYCTGIRFGEALRLRIGDVNTRSAILFIETFKGRARWVPFHRSLAIELDRYLTVRVEFAPADPDINPAVPPRGG